MDEGRWALTGGARKSRERWRALVEGQESSGLTQAEFCRRKGVHLGTFRRWKYQRLRKVARQAEASPPRFLPVEVEDQEPAVGAGCDAGVEVLIGNHRFRLGFDAESLRRAVEALAAQPC